MDSPNFMSKRKTSPKAIKQKNVMASAISLSRNTN